MTAVDTIFGMMIWLMIGVEMAGMVIVVVIEMLIEVLIMVMRNGNGKKVGMVIETEIKTTIPISIGTKYKMVFWAI